MHLKKRVIVYVRARQIVAESTVNTHTNVIGFENKFKSLFVSKNCLIQNHPEAVKVKLVLEEVCSGLGKCLIVLIINSTCSEIPY